MAHLYKCSEWQSASGKWYCGDTSDLGHGSGRWWIPARMLGLTPAAYVEMLIKDFQPDNIKFTGKILLFSWNEKNYSKAHKYVLWINRMARNKNFVF